jgi:DNA polymerase III epsilon subunit-like protein
MDTDAGGEKQFQEDPIVMITIDFEASCLPRHGYSYPIEVGISDVNGCSRAWLIRPHRSWDGWDWTEEAQNLHGISYDRLLREGEPVADVANALRQALTGHRVIADSWIDAYWLETLAAAASTFPPSKIGHISTVFEELGSTTQEIKAAQTELQRHGFRRHRAGDDARWLSALIGILTKASTAREYAPRTIVPHLYPASEADARPISPERRSAA